MRGYSLSRYAASCLWQIIRTLASRHHHYHRYYHRHQQNPTAHFSSTSGRSVESRDPVVTWDERACAVGYCMGMYGQLKDPPLSSMSRMSVSMGVFPTSRTKNSCSMTWAETVLSDGRRSRSLPNRVGCAGYCVRTYSSSAHCDFSCRFSMWIASVRPHASVDTSHTTSTFSIAAIYSIDCLHSVTPATYFLTNPIHETHI